MKNEFGARMKKLRHGLGLTQTQVAEHLGKSTSAVKMWETGANEPDMNTLVDLSILFDCSLDYLLCRDAKMNTEGAVRTNLPIYALSSYTRQTTPVGYQKIATEYLTAGNSLFWLKADTDEMAPLVPNGALVLMKHSDACMESQIALVRLQNGCYFRKVSFCNGGVILTAAKTDIAPVFIPCEDTSFSIIGTAVEYRYVY